jgi:gliding motility-associated-like protein
MGIINKKLLLFFTFFSSFVFTGEIWAQCDLEIYDFHPETLEITIIVNNGFGCNPNDPTDDEIDKFILGITSTELQADAFQCGLLNNPNGWILQNYFPNFTLWDDEAAYLGEDSILNTGDTLTFNLFEAQLGDAFAEECYTAALNDGYFDDCIEVVIWQINCSSDIYGISEPECIDEGGYSYPDVNSINNIYDVFCATDLIFGPETEFEFGCNVWNPEQFESFNDDIWRWIWDPLEIYNQGFSTAHEYTISIYYNGQLAVSVPYNSDLIDWISIPPEDNQTFYMTPANPLSFIDEELTEIKIVISDVYPSELDTTNNTLILTSPEDFIWDSCLEEGCTDQLACNFNPEAGEDDGSCNYPDECGICDGLETGPGAIYDCGCEPIPEGECDCDGNEPIDLFQCDCEGTPDLDQDGICDTEDDCVGSYDECGICNGPGAIYDCGCFDIPEGDCDCLGNVLDACGICGGTGTDIDGDGICDDIDPCIGVYDNCGVCNGDGVSCYGCTDPDADNYDPTSWIDDGSCTYCEGMFIPNTFTPNNDGRNDVWKPSTTADCWSTWDLKVYNRWGQIVWYTTDPEEPWLGQAEDGFYHIPDGVYVYKLDAVGVSLTNVQQLKGHITLFR